MEPRTDTQPEDKPSLMQTLRKLIDQEPEGSDLHIQAVATVSRLEQLRRDERTERIKELKRRKAAKQARKVTRRTSVNGQH